MYSELGEKVKLLRKRRNLKQDDLAKVLELGRRNLNLKQLDKLCNYFQIEMSYFLFAETTDSCIDLIDRAKLLFESKELSNSQKEEIFTSIMKLYLDSKGN